MKILFALILVTQIYGCVEKNEVANKENQNGTDSFIFNPTSYPADTIILTKVQIFGSSPDTFISNIGEFTVDKNGNVYIEEAAKGMKTIHVFNSKGSYITSLGREGKGPGEFIDLCCVKIQSDKLYFFDTQLSRLNIYNINSLSLVDVINISPTELGIKGATGLADYHLMNDSTFLFGFSNPPMPDKLENRKIIYFKTNLQSQNVSKKIIEQKQVKFIMGDFQGRKLMTTFPFFNKPLLTISKDEHIFTAQSRYFIIKEHDKDGKLLNSFEYPYKKVPVSREDAVNYGNDMTKNIARKIDLPEYWPVINTMQFDDENRLWVSTFTDQDDEIRWWVISRGKLLANFTIPGSRNVWPIGDLKNKKFIKNGFFYSREKNKESEWVIVKYKINLKSR